MSKALFKPNGHLPGTAVTPEGVPSPVGVGHTAPSNIREERHRTATVVARGRWSVSGVNTSEKGALVKSRGELFLVVEPVTSGIGVRPTNSECLPKSVPAEGNKLFYKHYGDFRSVCSLALIKLLAQF